MLPSPWGLGMPISNQQSPLTRQKRHSHIPSSPPDTDVVLEYPVITEFLARLDIVHPQRGLSIYAATFEAVDFYNIDELSTLSEERLTTPEFKMSLGNARFLLKEIKAEM
jgi:hypothetical protein